MFFSAPSGLKRVNRAALYYVSGLLTTYIQERILTGNGNTRDSLLVIVFEAKALGVVAQNLNVGQLKVNPVLAVENLGAFLGLSSSAGAVAVHTGSETSETHANIDGGQVGLLGSGRSGLGSGLRRVLAEALIGIAF